MKRSCGIILNLSLAAFVNAEIILTGVLDGDLPDGTPKAVELYVHGTENLANFKYAYQQNAATSWTFQSLSGLTGAGTFTDAFVYLVNPGSVDEFQLIFGTLGDFANVIQASGVNHNGDDRIGMASSSDVLLDYFGVAGEDGTGKTWEYTDGYAYRMNKTHPDGTFNSGNWTFNKQGVDGLNAAQHKTVVPFGTYAIPEPATMGLIGLFGGGLLVVRRLFSMG